MNDRTLPSRDDEYTVYIVKYGSRMGMRHQMFLNYELYGEPDGPAQLDYFYWVIRNRHRTIVVDTGFSAAGGAARGRTMLMHPAESLRALGISTESVDTVILTHAHYDHIGNADLFSSSALLMAQREFDFWTSELANNVQFSVFSEQAEIDALVAAEDSGRLQLISGSVQVAPGADMIEIGGHTPGVCVVRVRTDEGVVLLASDTMHLYEHFERAMPFIASADVPAVLAGYGLIEEMLKSGVTHLVSGHDPGTLARFRPSAVLPDLIATIGSGAADT